MFYRELLYAEDAGSRFLVNVGTPLSKYILQTKISCSVCYIVHKSFVLCYTVFLLLESLFQWYVQRHQCFFLMC